MDLLAVKRTLGLLSIAAGVVAVAAPDRESRFLGLRFDDQAMSAFGAREIASGAGLLAPVKPGPWFWMRAGGDVMDLVALGRAIGRAEPRKRAAYVALGAVAAIAVFDVVVAARASRHPHEDRKAAQ